eukprot:jgi/Tetstr1/447376/TSEL_034813.t1
MHPVYFIFLQMLVSSASPEYVIRKIWKWLSHPDRSAEDLQETSPGEADMVSSILAWFVGETIREGRVSCLAWYQKVFGWDDSFDALIRDNWFVIDETHIRDGEIDKIVKVGDIGIGKGYYSFANIRCPIFSWYGYYDLPLPPVIFDLVKECLTLVKRHLPTYVKIPRKVDNLEIRGKWFVRCRVAVIVMGTSTPLSKNQKTFLLSTGFQSHVDKTRSVFMALMTVMKWNQAAYCLEHIMKVPKWLIKQDLFTERFPPRVDIGNVVGKNLNKLLCTTIANDGIRAPQ